MKTNEVPAATPIDIETGQAPGQPHNGSPQHGQPNNGSPQHAQPYNGSPQHAQPYNGAPPQGGYAQPYNGVPPQGYAQPYNGPPQQGGYAQPYNGPPQQGGYVPPYNGAPPQGGYAQPPGYVLQPVGVAPSMMGGWKAGLCGCCTDIIPNCLMAWICPWISLAQISARLGKSSYCCGLCLACIGAPFPGFLQCMLCHLRSAARARYQIPGNCCGDLCDSCCCTCCAIAQTATRVGSYKPGSCDFGPQSTLPPYKEA